MISLADFPSLEWRRAMRWFDDGDPSIVAELVLKGEPMSLQVRQFVADIATGKRKPPATGKARKILNFDHKEVLRQSAQLIQLFGGALTTMEKQNIKSRAIENVIALSGVSNGTAQQAWKEANTTWAKLAKKNKAFIRTAEANQAKQKDLQRLRGLGLKNDPFKR
jgi:hypothetical protein